MLKKKILYEPWHLLSIIILGKDIIFHALAFIEYHYIRKFLVHINVDAQNDFQEIKKHHCKATNNLSTRNN